MGCGSSKDGTADSPTRKTGAANRRKTNADQVDVQVNDSDAHLSPSPSPSKTASARKDADDDNNFASYSNTTTPRYSENGGVNGRAKNSRYGDSERDETSFQEPNDKGYKRRVREKLKTATAGHDLEELDKMISLFERSRIEDCGDLTRALEKRRYLRLKRDLRDAIRRRHVGVLDKTIADVQSSPYAYQLHSQLEAAEKLRDHLKELNTYNHGILQMEQTTISELRSYQRPPSCVHDVMAATYMLLGYDEDRLTEWPDIQMHLTKLGKESLMRQVESFDTNDVDDTTASRVTEILGYHDIDQIRAASNGAARFHVWSTQMVEKIDKDKQNEDDRRRQDEDKQSQASSKGRKKKG